MDIIMDEARKRGMKVWILDDSHFPTGFANGAMEKADSKLARKNMVHQVIECGGAGSEMRLNLSEYREAPEWKQNQIEEMMSRGQKPELLPGDEIISIALIREGGSTEADIVDLTSEAAKERGVRFGRPENPLPDNFGQISRKWISKEITAKEAAQLCNMPVTSFYRKVGKIKGEPDRRMKGRG
jgi:hypothetical protein